MANLKYKIGVVTVTYGNRFSFLKRVVSRVLLCPEVQNVIIVDNASEYDLNTAITEITDDRIRVLNQTENTGSAGGYNIGVNYFLSNTDCDFVLLLDDDNLPEENTIADLLQHWTTINGGNDKKALYCLRKDRPQHIKIAQGEDPYRYYLVPDNFLGFNVFRIVKNQFYKLRDKFRPLQANLNIAEIPYVPYGGLFMHRELVEAIGLPDLNLYLYVDDSEYSYRITEQGGKIWLIPSASIVDIDRSEGIVFKTKAFHSKLLDMWSFRVYYHVRNRMYFYSRVAVKNSWIFSLNKWLYLRYLSLVAQLTGKNREYDKLLVAIDDGLKGRLGKVGQDKF